MEAARWRQRDGGSAMGIMLVAVPTLVYTQIVHRNV